MEQTKSQEIIETMLMLADISMANGDYERAIQTYKNILELQPNETAQYNLGSLYAQGKGVQKDFKEAAYWFNQVALTGDEQAKKGCIKCAMDFIHQDFANKTPEKIYFDMLRFVKFIWPSENIELEVNRHLYSMAENHLNKEEYLEAAKLFRAAAEFGNDGYSQGYIAVLYHQGNGVERSDLASLYWFDKALDNGIEEARTDRDGLLNAYRTDFSPAEFYDQMMILSGWCNLGSENVPKDANKAVYWRNIAESI